jgi:hypothetical protein
VTPHRAKQLLIRLAVVAFACRALVPIGFMPAPIDEGGPIKVCHGGHAGAFFRALSEIRGSEQRVGHDHASHGAHGHALPSGDGDAREESPGESAEHGGWEHCPTGAAFAASVLVAEVTFLFVAPAQSLEPIEPDRLVARLFVGSYQARAPPTV